MKKRTLKKMAVYALSAALVVSTSAFSSVSADAAKKATVKLNKTSVSIVAGKKVTLKVKKTNVKKIQKTTWSVKNKKIAKVTKKGVVTGVKAGKTTVTAKVTYLPKKGKKTTKSLKATIKVTAKKTTTTSTTATATKAPAGNTTTTAPNTNVTQAPNTDVTTAPDPTKAPDAIDNPGTDNPGTDNPGTDNPGTDNPGTDNPGTDNPGTDNPGTGDSGDETPVPVQSLKITVKDGDTVLKDAVVTITDSVDKNVVTTKDTDGVYTTDKLPAGKYTVQVAELPAAGGAGKYTAISKEVNISEDPENDVQEIEISMIIAYEDEEIYSSSEGLRVDSYYPAAKPGYKYQLDDDGEVVKDQWGNAVVIADPDNEDNKEVDFDFRNMSKAVLKITYTLREDAEWNQLNVNGTEAELLANKDSGTVSVVADVNLLQDMAGNGISFTGNGVYVNKITITVQERYEGANMHFYVNSKGEITDQMQCITKNGTYTFSWSDEEGVSADDQAIYLNALILCQTVLKSQLTK